MTKAEGLWSSARMANVLSEEKRQQVLALGRLEWSLRRIEEATGVRRETAKKYLEEAGVATRGPRARRAPAKAAREVTTGSADGKPAITTEVITGSDPAKAAREATTGSSGESGSEPGPTRLERPRPKVESQCDAHREVIELSLSRGRNVMATWQELVDEHGFRGSYCAVKRFVNRLQGARVREARVVITTAAGEEAQVDYGEGPMVRDGGGRHRRTRLFVLTLGHSRKSIRLLTFHSSSRIWSELHEKAFRRLGGAPRVVVLDNLREGVLKPDWYDPTINPLYRDVLAHYGVVALPCRVRDPDRKGKVESGVAHAQKTPLRGKHFETLEEAQAYLDKWEATWADKRIHGTTKRQVATMYAEEKPTLLPLPAEPFRYYSVGERTVHLDGCVEVEGAYYSTPPGWIGRRIPVQWDGHYIRILTPTTRELVREHPRQDRGQHRICPADQPSRTPLGTQALLARAGAAGKSIGAVARAIHDRDGETGVRRIQGLLSLAKKVGADAVEKACAAALELGVADYRFVRRYLERHPPVPLTLRQVDPIIRQLTLYRDLINHMTGEIQ